MATMGDRLRQMGRPNAGQGVPIQVVQQIPDMKRITRNNWAQGIVANDSPRDVPDQVGFGASTDIDVTRDDALTMQAGILVATTEVGHDLKYIFQHASVDYATELVVVDPPYIGIRTIGAFTWVNDAIGATGNYGWNAFNIAGTLIFSNGVSKTYTRAPGATTVTDISAQVIGRTFATAFGRAFAGAYTDGGGFQALGVKWNAANGFAADWTSSGAGAQLLIANQLEADIIVALRPIGFQALAVVNRKSLWIGYPTGQPNTPADFQQRYIGIGGINEKTTRVTQDGVIFLGDDGVFLFGINGLEFISEAINPLLLPIDYTRIDKYTAAFVPSRQRYILSTPLGMFIYELSKKRWLMRSIAADNVLSFTDQTGTASWDTTPGTWDQQTSTWDQMAISQTNAPAKAYFTLGNQLGYEDLTTLTAFGQPMAPIWITPDFTKDDVQLMVTTLGFEVEYISTQDCTVKLYVPNYTGAGFDGARVLTKVLPSTGGLRRIRILDADEPMASLGGRWRMDIVSGNAQFYRISQLYDPNSVSQTVTEHG